MSNLRIPFSEKIRVDSNLNTFESISVKGIPFAGIPAKNEYKDYNNFAVTDLHILYIFIISNFLNINVILIGKYFKWNR